MRPTMTTSSTDGALKGPLAVERVDPFSFAVVRLQAMFRDVDLGPATGFFFLGLLDNKPNRWLVTNWHVLTGRNADDPNRVLHSMGSLPNRLRMSLMIKPDQPEYAERGGGSEVLFQEQIVELYGPEGEARWYQHPRRNAVDIAVLNVGLALDRFRLVGINEPNSQNDMAIDIGSGVFILGYPLGFAHFLNTPIWKRGWIASEPHLETFESRSRVVIDATTRQGMSGGPVLMRERTHYVSETGEIKACVNATRWIGVYASRPAIPVVENAIEDDRRAEVGYYYKSGSVHETIVQGIRGPDFGALL